MKLLLFSIVWVVGAGALLLWFFLAIFSLPDLLSDLWGGRIEYVPGWTVAAFVVSPVAIPAIMGELFRLIDV